MTRDFAPSSALAERAAAWLVAGPADPVPARPAATVVLARDGAAGRPEVFLLHRELSMAFAAGMYVFPGGGVDPRDGDDLDVPWHGPPPARWAVEMGVPAAKAVALVCAAVRETFEECGVLLAGRPGEEGVVDVRNPAWEGDRQRLLTKETALSDLLEKRGLVLRSDLLRAWAHWTTPEFEPRRYDTWFFLATLPLGQRARHVGGEAASSGWWTAAGALADAEAGRVALMPPTLVTIEEVAAAAGVAELWASDRDLTEVLPRLVRVGGEVVMRTDLTRTDLTRTDLTRPDLP